LFLLSGGAAVLARYGGVQLPAFAYAAICSGISALWLVVAVYFLGDISAHFNPAMTFAFALRRDMGWPMAGAYIVVQFVAAIAGTFLAQALFGSGANLAATIPKPGLEWPSVLFEAILVFGLVLMVLSMANGPKLNGAYFPLAVGAFAMSVGTMGGPYDGAAFNPARAVSPDLAIGNLSTYWGSGHQQRSTGGDGRPARFGGGETDGVNYAVRHLQRNAPCAAAFGRCSTSSRPRPTTRYAPPRCSSSASSPASPAPRAPIRSRSIAPSTRSRLRRARSSRRS
jgi:glycerol uptake facilitator-like aquaporin